jgi:LysM repeat protein
MQLLDFLDKLKLAHDVPNFYCNKPGKNLGYHWEDGRFSFDCWNLIKAILAGWDATNPVGTNVPPTVTGDISGYQMLMQCTNRSKDFTRLKQPGAYLYLSTSPQAGVYVGDFEYENEIFNVVECTGAWESKVQYTYVDETGARFLYKGGPRNNRWTDYGLLPWVDYNEAPAPVIPPTYGIDVSRYQRGFDLKDAKIEGFTYTIIKAGGADGSVSNPYYKDASFDDFYIQAKQDKMYIGAYYFGRAFSIEDAQNEANHFISLLKGKDIVHVYYDVEGKMLNQGYTHLTDIIRTFCQTLINAGYACGIYTSESQFNSRFNDAQLIMYPHWVAKYSKNPPKLNSIALVEIWQYGGSINYIRSPKIAGTTVDQDLINIPWVDDGSIPKDVAIAEPVEYKKSVDQLANEVLAGVWGSGVMRQMKLTAAGYSYREVQDRVNEIVASRKKTKKTYVVCHGDTLSSIAKRYNTTVDQLVNANGIPDKNKIYCGQELTIV